MNRITNRSLSAKEIILQRDQITNELFSTSDINLSEEQDTSKEKPPP